MWSPCSDDENRRPRVTYPEPEGSNRSGAVTTAWTSPHPSARLLPGPRGRFLVPALECRPQRRLFPLERLVPHLQTLNLLGGQLQVAPMGEHGCEGRSRKREQWQRRGFGRGGRRRLRVGAGNRE